MSELSRRNTKHQKKPKTKWIIGGVATVGILSIAGYALGSNFYSKHFLPNTQVEAVEISNMSLEQAKKTMADKNKTQTLQLLLDNQVVKEINKSDFGMQADFKDTLKSTLKKQNPWSWGSALFKDNHVKNDTASFDNEILDQKLAELKTELEQLNQGRTTTQDAQITKDASGFVITNEVVGNTFSVDEALKAIKKDLLNGQNKLNLNNYIHQPTIKANDSKLQEQLAALNKIAQITANYSINGTTFQIPNELIADWLNYENNQVTINQEKVQAYVQQLADQYNTSTNPTSFNSTKRGVVSVPAGTLSWSIQVADEAKALADQIMQGANFTRSPITKGSAKASQPLVGNTYIEVDLTNQHMWYYKDGALVLETDVVTGKPTTPTPKGVDYVWKKERNATLKGTNDDGSKYESPVSYWMPIDWTGVGIHDSDWQPAYGGNLWQTRGSHGCVNTPPSVMAQLYAAVEVGTPVLIF
ncbi:MAG TPA: L,D-transpeptidase family protein [Enterococcus columbae]|nr:L,D-transpeptidase family protein [Enterococcus columbae]